ncbi:MAG TPA: response regulator [Burkholderiales bacterium]|nr:response regulator [Burkholderiales bacterium]
MAERAKILIVDDSELSVEILHTKLSEYYDIVSTNAPDNALKLAREVEPDLILCDLDMPEMDGAEVSEALRADEELRDIPLLFLTALASSGDLLRMRKQLGGRPAVSKDAPLTQLVARIEALLKKHT